MDDYILRDAAKVKIWKCPETLLPTQEAEDYLIAQIDSIHAADVRPVKRGIWAIGFGYPNPIGTFCSKCGFAWSEQIAAVTLEPVLSRIKTNFCPNCGAMMGEAP